MKMLRIMFKIIVIGLVSLVVLIGVAIGGAIAYRAYQQHQISGTFRIQSPNGIDEAMFVEIGGLRQWVQIRGEDKDNPVILLVHGGPALSMIPFTYHSMRGWEKYFTIVHWDQRGAGRTYLLNGGADTTATGMRQIIDDGVQVSTFVRSRLHKDKIIVLGESWGSAVALEMARQRPDLFHAYVGTGQAIDMRRAEIATYRLLLERVRAEHDDNAVQQLTTIGPPPYTDLSLQTLEQKILGANPAASESTGALEGMAGDFFFAPGYSLRESYQIVLGATKHRSNLVAEDNNYKASSHGQRFELPVFFFQGSEDIQAPLQLVAEYVQDISAPQKQLVVFPGGGHNTYYFSSERFLEELRARVRPLSASKQQ
jgi:pimeloyl-ACP methyl ester carboxylesterase